MPTFRFLFCCGSLALFCAACHRTETPPAIFVRAAPATLKLTRTQPIERFPLTIELSAARNEVEPFQIVVQARGRNLERIHASLSDLVSAGTGHRLAAKHATFFREYFLNVLQTTGDIAWMPRMEYPDPLLPFVQSYSNGPQPYGAPFDNARVGSVGQPYRAGRAATGSVFPEGRYTGRGDRRFVIQIERTGRAGAITFRWSDSWKKGFDRDARVGAWAGRQIPVPPLQENRRSLPVALTAGLSVVFCAGRDPHFEEGQTFHFNAYDAMNEVIWGDLRVPPETPPGTYTGRVQVTADGLPPCELPVTLTVHDFELPRTRSVATAFGGWMVAEFYADCPRADLLFEQLLHEHRIDCQTIHGQRTEWQGRFGTMDWTAFDAAAEPRLSGSAYPDGAPMTRFHLGMYQCGYDHLWEGAANRDIAQVEFYGKLFAEHLKKKGWFDRVYMYCRDEPEPRHVDGIVRDAQAFLRGDADWKGKFMVTSLPTPGSSLLDWMDIWCVKYHWWIEPAVMERLQRDGRALWCYAANTPIAPNPAYHIDSVKGYEPRLIKWAAWQRGAEGFLHWAMALDQEYPNPWTTPMNDFGACGDANFVYYGARNGARLNDNATPLPPIMGPLPSFRLKQIREGLEDWEVLLLCERKRGRAFTAALVGEVYRAPGGRYGQRVKPEVLDKSWTQDDWKLYDVREKLAAAIEAVD